MRKVLLYLGVLLLMTGTGLAPAPGRASDGSHVIGRIAGTRQPLPVYFHGTDSMERQGIEEVEFTGFRLVRKEDGKKYAIYPNREGFFHKALMQGHYSLIRDRRDRPAYREEGTIVILEFDAPSGTVVNLGTLDLVLSGKPSEFLGTYGRTTRGKYIYRYGYERRGGPLAYQEPLEWFGKRKPGIVEKTGSRVLEVEDAPAPAQDSSEVVLEEKEIPAPEIF